MEDRRELANTLEDFVRNHPEVYSYETQTLVDIFTRYASGGLAVLALSEREQLRGVYADRFFDLVR